MPSGVIKILISKILTTMGKITTAASGTNLPVKKAIPQINSITLAVGNKYTDASIPSLKIFIAPVTGGGVKSLKR